MLYDQILLLESTHVGAIPRKVLDFTKWDGVAPHIVGYPLITWWRPSPANVCSLKTLAKALYYGANAPSPMCAVRGETIDPFATRILRAKNDKDHGPAGIKQRDRRWICLDLDRGFVHGDLSTEQGCIKAANDLRVYLPPTLRDSECVIHFSSTARNEKVKAHFWFWLPTFVCDDAMHHWAESVYCVVGGKPTFDPSMFRTVQPHYIADPLVIGTPREGWVVAKRWHYIQGKVVAPEMMPREWVDSFGWNKELSRMADEDQVQRIANFKPSLPYTKNSAKYAEAVTKGLCEDIYAISSSEGSRHNTILAKAHRALMLEQDGTLSSSQVDEVRQAAYSILPRDRHSEVDRLFKQAGRSARSTLRPSIPIKRTQVILAEGSPQATKTHCGNPHQQEQERQQQGIAQQMSLIDTTQQQKAKERNFD